MTEPYLEHVNITVSDPDAVAQRLVDILGWRIRWSGASIHEGRTVHVGGERSYVALYSQGAVEAPQGDNYRTQRALNHMAVVVDDLDEIERRVIAAGLEPHSHQEYDPGKRFYFHDPEGMEYEVISYRADNPA